MKNRIASMHKMIPGLKKRPVLVSLACLILIVNVSAGIVIYSGTNLKVLPGTKLVTVESMGIKSGAVLDNAGSILLGKDFTNENTGVTFLGNGTFEMSGSIPQIISGQNIFQTLVIKNGSGVSVSGNTRVEGILSLISGRVYLGNYYLQLGTNGVISGTISPTAMIVATATGELRKSFPDGFTGTFLFPVGDATDVAEYTPVLVNIQSGTFGTDNYIGVNLTNSIYPDPTIAGNYLNRYWTLGQSGIIGLNCSLIFTYVAADVVGDEYLLSCTKVNPLPWTTYGLANPVTHQLTASSLASFGTFTGVKSTTPPVNNELQNITIDPGVVGCYDAQQQLILAGNGSTFIVANGGSSTLIAGGLISLLPGVLVQPGGYLHGYITTTGNYCFNQLPPLAAALQPETIMALNPESAAKISRIKAYPNPTRDRIMLDLSGLENSGAVSIHIFNSLGKIILAETTTERALYPVTLAGQPSGLYLIYIKSTDKSEIVKIVKN